MKKTLIPVLVLVLLLAAVLPASAATPAPGGPFSTAFRVQNLEASTNVTCDYTFYNSSGGTAFTSGQSAPIVPGDSLFVYVPNLSSLASGSYSGVVGCTGKVAAVANFSDADSGASFNGISQAATTWFAPAVYNNYFNFYSSVVVQNASSSPVNITLEIFAAGNATAIYSDTKSSVPAYASVNFEQEGLGQLATNTPYSAKVTATGPVAPVVTIYGKAAAANQLYSYNPFQAGSKTMYAPVVMKNYFGYNSALVIQNMGAATTTVTVTYSTGHSQSQDLTAGAAWSIYVPSQGPSGLPSGNSGGLFSATVTSSTENIALLVNESNNFNRAASFTGFAGGSTTVQVPALEKAYFNYNSSVTCQVLSGGPAAIRIEYFEAGASKGFVDSAVTANGQTALFYQPSAAFLPTNWLGSAKITSAASIACVVNQDMNQAPYSTTSMDQLFAYEGVAP